MFLLVGSIDLLASVVDDDDLVVLTGWWGHVKRCSGAYDTAFAQPSLARAAILPTSHLDSKGKCLNEISESCGLRRREI